MCIFCDIARGKQKADLVYQDRDVVAFRDIRPKAPVHILVIPRKHIVSISTLKKKEAPIISKMVWTAKELAEKENLRHGYKLILNCGKAGGQVVGHLHLHLLGGWEVSFKGRK